MTSFMFQSMASFIILLIMCSYFHPVMLTFLLVLYSITVFMNMSIWKTNYMYSTMMFLIIISGLLVLILYFSSLITNMPSTSRIKLMLFLYIMIMLYLFYKMYTLSFMNTMFNSYEANSLLLSNNLQNKSFISLYKYPYTNITMLSIFYLLLTMFIIIKICNSLASKPLRKI